MDVSTIITGDSLLTRSNTFLSQSIIWWMKEFAEWKNIDVAPDDFWSHSEFCFREKKDPKHPKIIGAIASGAKIRYLEDEYDLNSPDVRPMRLRRYPTDAEKDKMIKEVYHLENINLRYQYANFFQWIVFITSRARVNLFKDNKAIVYCLELTYRIYQAGIPWSFTLYAEITDVFKLNDPKRFVNLKEVENENII